MNAKGFPTKHNKAKADEICKVIGDKDMVLISETGANENNKIKVDNKEFIIIQENPMKKIKNE